MRPMKDMHPATVEEWCEKKASGAVNSARRKLEPGNRSGGGRRLKDLPGGESVSDWVRLRLLRIRTTVERLAWRVEVTAVSDSDESSILSEEMLPGDELQDDEFRRGI